MNKNTENKIKFSCDCGEIEMEIAKHTWKNGKYDYFLDFKISAFYAGQSVIEIIKERLNLAWLSLWKGNYYFQNMETTKEALEELRDKLIEMFPKE